jgi:hypothetical protein
MQSVHAKALWRSIGAQRSQMRGSVGDEPGPFVARTGAHVSPPGDLLRSLTGGSALRPAGVFYRAFRRHPIVGVLRLVVGVLVLVAVVAGAIYEFWFQVAEVAGFLISEVRSAAAPIAWNGLVFIGGAGMKGRMYALDAMVWKFYIVPSYWLAPTR